MTIDSSAAVFSTFYQDINADVYSQLKAIKLVILDVDGSITDGSIVLDRFDNEVKRFNAKEGMGISLLLKNGIEVAIITGRNSPLTARRAQELKIKYVIQGQADKEQAIKELTASLGLTSNDVAVLGDDLNDIPLYNNAAIKACPRDGYYYMQTIANLHLTRDGGRGAAREFADIILMAQGILNPENGCPFALQNTTGAQ